VADGDGALTGLPNEDLGALAAGWRAEQQAATGSPVRFVIELAAPDDDARIKQTVEQALTVSVRS
jgi:hypothetical protein